MNSKRAKTLRRMAKIEMATDQGASERELVVARKKGSDIVINNPNTTRAMYLHLKSAYAQVTRRAA